MYVAPPPFAPERFSFQEVEGGTDMPNSEFANLDRVEEKPSVEAVETVSVESDVNDVQRFTRRLDHTVPDVQ